MHNYVKRGWRSAENRDDTPADYVYTHSTETICDKLELTPAHFGKVVRRLKLKPHSGRGRNRLWTAEHFNQISGYLRDSGFIPPSEKKAQLKKEKQRQLYLKNRIQKGKE